MSNANRWDFSLANLVVDKSNTGIALAYDADSPGLSHSLDFGVLGSRFLSAFLHFEIDATSGLTGYKVRLLAREPGHFDPTSTTPGTQVLCKLSSDATQAWLWERTFSGAAGTKFDAHIYTDLHIGTGCLRFQVIGVDGGAGRKAGDIVQVRVRT